MSCRPYVCRHLQLRLNSEHCHRSLNRSTSQRLSHTRQTSLHVNQRSDWQPLWFHDSPASSRIAQPSLFAHKHLACCLSKQCRRGELLEQRIECQLRGVHEAHLGWITLHLLLQAQPLQEVSEQLALWEELAVVPTTALMSLLQVEQPRSLSDMALPQGSPSTLQVAGFKLL